MTEGLEIGQELTEQMGPDWVSCAVTGGQSASR